MSALTTERATRELLCNAQNFANEYEVDTAKKCYAGGLVAIDTSGKAEAASDAASLVVAGVAQNTAAAGEKVEARTGVYLFENGTSTEAIATDDFGKLCYVVDDQTVGLAGGTNKLIAGVIRGVFDGLVAVEVGNVCLSVITHSH